MAVGIICVILIMIGVFAIKHYAWKLVRSGNNGTKRRKTSPKEKIVLK